MSGDGEGRSVTKPIRILLADDHALIRAGVRALFEKLPGVEVVAEAADARRALDVMETHRPDVVLMDLSMPGLNGLEGTARIAKDYPWCRVLVLSGHTDEEHVRHALRAGASGYLVKDSVPTELELAVRAVARGQTYLSPAVAGHAVAGKAADGETSFDQLTPRLREILQLIAEGHSTKEIARILGTSAKTVENQRCQLMKRLKICDVAGLVRYAVQTGLIDSNRGSSSP
jgi:DNA-binding NarL/FixJ family response regulator